MLVLDDYHVIDSQPIHTATVATLPEELDFRDVDIGTEAIDLMLRPF